MSWAAANLIEKTKKEKKKQTVRKSEEVEWESTHHLPAGCAALF